MAVIIGIDAEWQTITPSSGTDKFVLSDGKTTSDDRPTVSVLSYQWFGLDGERTWSDIYYPDLALSEKKKRLKLSQWVSLALQQGFKNRTWPEQVVVASHYTTAEMSVISDFNQQKTRLDLIQGSSYASVLRPLQMRCYDKSDNRHDVTVSLLDSMLLAPPDETRSLDKLGSLLGLEKLTLPSGHSKSQMLRFLEEEPEHFKEYAIRDAEITARYIRRIEQECNGLGLDNYRPVTIGGLATRVFLETFEGGPDNRTYDSVMGIDNRRVQQRGYGNRARIYQNERATYHEDIAIKCYHGGRNECFLFGYHDGIWTDYDLEGAYSTALAAYIEPDFSKIRRTENLDDFHLDQMGFALATWKFPKDTRFPCLFERDRDGHGLIYVLEGEGYLTSPEIALARRMGAEITIRDGIVVPFVKGGIRPFLHISRWVKEQRDKFPKHTHAFENSFYKLIGNNVYGKVAQGLKNTSRVFDSRIGSTRQLERSRISDAYCAAFTTGIVRATTSEILSKLPDDVVVGNSITDGVCTTATEEQMSAATTGPQCKFFSQLREMICGDPTILVIKGQVDGMVFMRTRMHGTIGKLFQGYDPILAHVNFPMGHLKKEDSDAPITLQECNDELLRAFREREWNQEWSTRRLTTARDLYDDEHLDLVHDEYIKFVGMDYDFKRKPFKPTTNHDHLAFETNPWLNHKEYSQTRKVFDTFQEPIKTEMDLEVFFQDVHTRGNKKHRPRPKRRLKLYAKDFIKRAAVADDGIANEDGSPLKPREINTHVSAMTNGSMGASGEAVRKWRSRIKADPTKLEDEYVEYTSSVSAAHEYVTTHFTNHKGKAIKRVSSIRMIPKK